MKKLLLATDLDRTIIPNGSAPESPKAREMFNELSRSPSVTLTYVSGRNQDLLQRAISTYNLPLPDYAVGDVGTTIYEIKKATDHWHPLDSWEKIISQDWQGKAWADIKSLFDDLDELRLQDDNPAFQNKFKVSFYTDKNVNRDTLLANMEKRALEKKLKLSFVFSIDGAKNVGLLDVLPLSATKIHAIHFLVTRLEFPENRVIFCGDSGNDIPALTSGLKAVMVKNTRSQVVEKVLKMAREKNIERQIYHAQGNFLDMNGNYSAGVLEGIAHFFPETMELIKSNS